MPVITNLLTDFALIGLVVGLLVSIFRDFIFLWLGLKIFKITSVSVRQILLYVLNLIILSYVIGMAIGIVLDEISQSFFIQILISWVIYAALTYFLLRFFLKLSGVQFWKLLAFLVVISLLVSIAFNFQNYKQLSTQGSLTRQSTTSFKDKSIEDQQNIKSRDSQRKSDLYKIRVALEEYFAENRSYPSTKSRTEKVNEENYESSILYKALVPSFLTDPLFDPIGNFYNYRSDGQSFELTATLENLNDPDCQTENGECIYRHRSLR